LIEIGLEELPAEPLLKEVKNIETKWGTILEKFNLSTGFQFFYTPRRLVFWHREFLAQQPNQIIELFGAPISIAYKNGVLTKAGESFAKKCGISVEDLTSIEKDGKEVLYYKYEEAGKSIDEVLETMIFELLNSLNFGKSMRWGSGEFSFIRPIHSIVSMFGDRNIPLKVFGVESKAETFGHRSGKREPIFLTHTGDYFCNLPKDGVMVKQSERELTILKQFKDLEKSENIKIEVDGDLLNEVVALTEEPNSLLGTFDDKFLSLPKEVIITSMKTHQRYFPVFKDGELTNKFVVVSNALTDDFSNIVSGNERVLRARLSDALFFYENDIKKGLHSDGLEKVVFVEGLGSIADKVEREFQIAKSLQDHFHFKASENLERAVKLAKNDLLTEMVYEFPELQGLMGSYYAEKQGEHKTVITAIREQYFPIGENGELPSSGVSMILALSHKLDLLFGLFSIGHIPTGSRDPFGLRRAVNGIIKIVNNEASSFDLKDIFEDVKDQYKVFDFSKLEEFFYERVYSYYGDINPSIIKSVLLVEKELKKIDEKVKTVLTLTKSEDFDEKLSTFKRVANILKDENVAIFEKPKIELFVEKAEFDLLSQFEHIENRKFESEFSKIEAIFELKPHLDNFFNSVMVNAPEENIRLNRKSLMAVIYKKLIEVADIREISIR
jgi:glycyl-tRNA synthetase beta chain